MSRIPGFVVGPAPQVYCVQQPLPYTQVVQQPANTMYIPPASLGSRVIVSNPTQVVYANPRPNVVYVNRGQPGQLSVIGGRLGASIGSIVDTALAPPPPQITTVYHHQYSNQVPPPPPYGAQPPPYGAQPPCATQQGYPAQQQGYQHDYSKPPAKPN